MKIKNKLLILFLFVIFLNGIGYAQDNFFISNTNFPVPPYIKRGLVIYYNSAGYVVREGKRRYVSFEKIMVIQKIEGQKVIGIMYSLNPSSSLLTIESKILGQGGSGTFYVHPEYAKKMKGKETFGYKFVTDGKIEYRTENTSGEIAYDPKSGVFLSLKVVTNNSEAIDIYKGYEYVNLPPLPNDFPQVARNSYTYTMSSIVQGMGTMPVGSISISPISFGKQIAKFRLTTTQTQGLTSTQEVFGTTLLGPHYIHPDILKGDITILKLTKKDFNYYIQGEGGQMIAHLIIDGTEYSTTYVDPQTGIVLAQDQQMGDIGILRFILNQ